MVTLLKMKNYYTPLIKRVVSLFTTNCLFVYVKNAGKSKEPDASVTILANQNHMFLSRDIALRWLPCFSCRNKNMVFKTAYQRSFSRAKMGRFYHGRIPQKAAISC